MKMKILLSDTLTTDVMCKSGINKFSLTFRYLFCYKYFTNLIFIYFILFFTLLKCRFDCFVVTVREKQTASMYIME